MVVTRPPAGWPPPGVPVARTVYIDDAHRGREARQLCKRLLGADSAELAAAQAIGSTVLVGRGRWQIRRLLPPILDLRTTKARRRTPCHH